MHALCRNRATPDEVHGLAQALGSGPWLLISPHDDDVILGAGATIAAACAEGIEVHVAVVSDGRMGWNDPADRAGLAHTREQELRQALAKLGVGRANTHLLGFTDGSLHLERGCRPDEQGAGIGRSLARLLRQVQARTLLTCTAADTHPDHQVVAAETAIAAIWASGSIWQELGAPIEAPKQWAYAVYCDFPTPPSWQVTVASEHQQAKLCALRCFRSQAFIDEMTARVQADGPLEYFADVTTLPYRPARYAALFIPRA